MFGMMKETKKLPVHVKAWMGVMVVTFGSHAFFIDSPLHVLSLATFVVTLAIFAPASFALTQNVSAIAASHFLAWPIVLANGIQHTLAAGLPSPITTAEIVLLAGYVVFFISLVLDYRIVLSELRLSTRVSSVIQGEAA